MISVKLDASPVFFFKPWAKWSRGFRMKWKLEVDWLWLYLAISYYRG